MNALSPWLSIAAKSAIVLLALNEVRGVVLAAPVIWSMYQAGGSLVALWLGLCSLLGIALSVAVPLLAVRVFRRSGG